MPPLTRDTLQGVWGTLLLPLRDDDSIDFDLLKQELLHLVAAGVSGIYSNGSAGEFWTQNETEFDRINGMLAEVCAQAGLPFQIGASHTSPQATLDLVRRARLLQPSGLQVILPDWLPVGVNEAIAFLRRVAEVADGIPLILYNPPHAKSLLKTAELRQVIDAVPEVAGIKVLGGGANWYAGMKPVLGKIPVFLAGHRMARVASKGRVAATPMWRVCRPRARNAGGNCWQPIPPRHWPWRPELSASGRPKRGDTCASVVSRAPPSTR